MTRDAVLWTRPALPALGVLASSIFVTAALARQEATKPAAAEVAEPPIVLEAGPVDPPLPISPRRATSPGAKIVQGGFTSIQVNVNVFGSNIVGDAANEPSIAVDPLRPNRMAVGWRQFDDIRSNFRQAGYSFTQDGGRTWAGMQIIEPGLFRSDPVLRSGPDGTFYYLSLGTSTGPILNDMFISTDGGISWPTKIFAVGGDKQWFSIDSTGGMGDGHFYQCWNTGGNSFFPAQFSRSVTGAMWETPIEYTPGSPTPVRPVFGLTDVGPDGAVYVAGSNNSANASSFWVVKSSDAKNSAVVPTFGLITPLNMGGNLRIGVGPNPAGLLGQVTVVVDKSGGPDHGDVYVLCSVDPPGTDPMDVMFIRSDDGGATFSAPLRVNDDTGDHWQWFGALAVAPNGRLDVVWNDTRKSGSANLSQLYHSSSSDGGRTWSANVEVSPVFDSFVGWPNQNKLGDYYDIISDDLGANVIYAATFNGEQDVYYVRIGEYDCNVNGVADSFEISGMISPDCDGNGIPDQCQIDAGASSDFNDNGIPDHCELARGDSNLDGVVNVLDLLAVLTSWGPCPSPCQEDANLDGEVNVLDLLIVLGNWD